MTAAAMPAEVFPPGGILRDELVERGWSETDLAIILGRPVQVVSEILNGRKEITPETAVALGEALGTSPESWLNQQMAWRLFQVRSQQSADSPVARRAKLRSLVPVTELRRRGWLPDTDDLDTLEESVCELLAIADPDQAPRFVVAARRSNAGAEFAPQQLAWIARIRNLAAHRDLPPFEPARLERLAGELVSVVRDPYDLAELEGWFAELGVALVIELPLRNSKMDGAAMMLDNGTPVIGLSTRGDRFDSFLFTLLHECGHILLGHVDADQVTVDEELYRQPSNTGIEADANRRADSWIFPSGFDPPTPPFSMSAILALARSHGVHPSFIIGNLQQQNIIPWEKFRSSIPKVRPFVGAP